MSDRRAGDGRTDASAAGRPAAVAPVRLATNMRLLQSAADPDFRVEEIEVSTGGSWRDTFALLRRAQRCDAILLNIATATVLKLCLLRWLWPFFRWQLISVDILLPRPVSAWQRLAASIKRLLLRRVDLFILYFRDLAGYQRFYSIGADRVAYVPFKSNSWERLPPPAELSSDGRYVLTAGRTMRDLETFVAAMRCVPFPGTLMYLRHENLAVHGTSVPGGALPDNVRLLEHDGQRNTWIEHMRAAKVVVVSILPETISSSGIGTCIDAMAMNKAVVITDGPSTRELLTDQAIVVPARDPAALAEAIDRVWRQDELRENIARRGRSYAETLQGEARLHRDIAAEAGRFVRAQRELSGAGQH